MTHYTDSKFDAIRTLPAMDLVGIRRGWRNPELADLVREYDAAIAAENRSELLKMAASLAAKPASYFDDNDRNFYL